MGYRLILLCCLTFSFLLSCLTVNFAQDRYTQRPPDAATLYRDIEKLGVLGTVMYMAAHPDDENTRIISWFSRQKLTHTVYLSLTRGDGGQNLIGTEISELLGVLRTQELLGARQIDGGEQWFTRANDFGYSKNAEETMQIWNKDAVLADVVWAIRKFRPDIIVNRFNAETSGSTHGHHTASATLALEAFDLAADPTAFPEQLAYVSVWQPRRIFFNTSWWFYGSHEAFDQADKSKMSMVDIGVYEPWSGFSNSEIAMKSRSMHRCQGFGSELYRGETPDYLDLLKGDLPPADNDPLSGIDLSWQRVSGGQAIQSQIDALIRAYDFRDPAASFPGLTALYRQIKGMPDHHWKGRKLDELRRVIADCAGLFMEARSGQNAIVPGQSLTFTLEITQRAGLPFTLHSLDAPNLAVDTLIGMPLALNQPIKINLTRIIHSDLPYTAPYWLLEPAKGGLYTVDDPLLRGLPESPNPLEVTVNLMLEGEYFPFVLPIVHKEIDPAFGERYQPLQVLPAGFVTPEQPVAIFPDNNQREVKVRVRAGRDDWQGVVAIELPEGWRATPMQHEVAIDLQGDEKVISFYVAPPKEESTGEAQLTVTIDKVTYPYSLREVKYEHIPNQSVLQPSTIRLVHVPLASTGLKIGYFTGAGDQIPDFLREAGYVVTILEETDLATDNLSQFDAVVAGIRAYNTREILKYRQEDINEYVRRGGTYLVQYNTNRGLVTSPSPLPLKVSRQRVTDENAAINILAPDHPVMLQPNLLGPADFQGWVQERGLYFPDSWDPAFIPILGAADPGETESQGMLLVAPYGEGYYVYTGLSFFRQLPAGVPGAYRLLANLLALSKTNRP